MQKYIGIKGDEVIETLPVAATTTSQTVTFSAATMLASPTKLVVSNAGTVHIHVKIGNSTVTATTNDAVVLQASVREFRFGAGDSVAIRTSSGTAAVHAEAVL